MCKKLPGAGWNKRKRASNNFVKAIRKGEITESILANILGVTSSILVRMIRGSLHHFQPNKKVKEIRTYKEEVITLENIVLVKAKQFEETLREDDPTAHIAAEKKKYKQMLLSDQPKLERKKESILKKWSKASEKLKAKYAPELSNEELL